MPPVLTERLGGHGWGRAIRVLAPLGALVVEGWPALIGTLLIQEGGLWLAGRLVGACERGTAKRLFLAAYGLRVAITLPTHYFAKVKDGNGALFQDAYTNDLVAEWLVRIARGDGIAIFRGHQHLLDSVYTYLLMGIHAIFGFTPVVPKLLNVGLAALCAVLIFEMARRIFRMPAALIAGLGAALLPSLVIWSVAALKESLVLFVALLGLRTVQYLAAAPRQHERLADALVSLLAIVVLLIDLRSTTAAILLGLLLIVFIARSNFRVRSWQLGLTALALVVLVGGGVWFTRARTSNRPIAGVIEDVVLQIRHRRAQEAAGANSQVRPEGDTLTATGAEIPTMEAASDATAFTVTGDIVEPLGYALLAPAPWQARSLTELSASAEMPIWYVLLAASCLAWHATPAGQRLFVVCLLAYGIANWLVLAASEGNVGNLLRHRLMLDPVLLILGGAGLEWLWVRAGRPFSTRLPARLVPARGDG
jgi:4-amino-4-deoxy-L-arabinose transferase-like glycosyltransferase